MTTIVKGRDLDACCESVRYETGQLYFSCTAPDDPNRKVLVTVSPQDQDYLPAITWAINSGKLGGDKS
ncbi:hypothetical protein [Propionivibrio dicarboxylicus]|uniref:Uncharacterized protein n=1 Tax=Propionivibrio dicarboxylicus TaxID=83767 RepID=A0A1G8LEZ9_9RHOO|nr:hypothetical protein [Propionivibrio dicarboxylicus]SDI54213.1 hypothetical protein SAMN05660652_03619 [Propionivibrio dicarboxylicus]